MQQNESMDDLIVENEQRLDISRQIYTQKLFDRKFSHAEDNQFSIQNRIKKLCFKFKHANKKHYLKKQLYRRIPSLKWLPNYDFKQNFFSDFVSGITIGIIQITQGMAYGLLASLPSVYGLYTSIFAGLVYWIFGTSHHISIGAYAVVSLMVGTTVTKLQDKYAPPENFNSTLNEINRLNNSTYIDTSNFIDDDRNTALSLIASSQCLWVGFIHLLMGLCQLGFLGTYLSEPLVKGFTVASAFMVCTSQLKSVFGLKMTTYNGPFNLIKTYIELFSKISETNWVTFGISAGSIVILQFFKSVVNNYVQKYVGAPFPAELLVVVLGTIICYFGNLNKNYNVKIIGMIPSGLPSPRVPPIFIIKDMIVDCLVIVVIAFTINYSAADIFAKKFRYKINSTQELIAAGISNIFASFFRCFTGCASLSRTYVQVSTGGKTQTVSIISSIILIITLYTISSVFYYLPRACLAAIVIVALINPVLKITELKYYWKINKFEFFHFFTICFTIIIFSVDIGIGVGIGLYIITHFTRQTKPNVVVLGNIPGTELYKDIKLYKDAKEHESIKIIRIEASLHNSNAHFFRKTICKLTEIKLEKALERKLKLERAEKKSNERKKFQFLDMLKSCFVKKISESNSNVSIPQFSNDSLSTATSNTFGKIHEVETVSTLCKNSNPQLNVPNKTEIPKLEHIIIDCSCMPYIDSVGVKTISELINDFNEINIKVYLADCNDSVHERFIKMITAKNDALFDQDLNEILFLTIRDAVLYALYSDHKLS